ncbi:MAG: EamA family transporter [Actinomycetota bacterium]
MVRIARQGAALGSPLTTERVPAQLYLVAAAIFHYLGPSFAVLLFTRVAIGGVVWLRIASAALVFAVWRRPWRAFAATPVRTRWLIAWLGAVIAAMNYSFYFAIDVLPLGTVAAIEFIGPIALAALGVRSLRNVAAFGLVVTGVYVITDLRLAGEPVAFAWAFANAALFTAYILIAHRISRSDPTTRPIDRLGSSMLIAAVAITPLGIWEAVPAFTDPALVGAGIAVGVTSSVIPYALDQMAMARILRSTYALFVALLPATAVVIGAIVLHQFPTLTEAVAVGFVICGVLAHEELT